jgi:hypothetical protein
MATNKLDVKKIIKGIVKNKKKRDIVSLILIVNNLEHKRISVEGNDTLKPIDSIEDVYMFFLIYLPEAILSSMTPKSKFVSTKKRDLKHGEKQKEEDDYDDHDSNELTTENKAFILKYLFLYAKIYSKISNRDEIKIEKSRLMKLLSIIDTPKLSVKALSWLIVSFKSEESILTYLRSYIKTCITIQKPAIENALNVVSTLIPYFDLDATKIQALLDNLIVTLKKLGIKSFFLPFYNFLIQACKKFRHKLRKSKTDVNEKTADEIISESYLNICTLCYHIITKLQNNARTDLRIRE